MKPIAPTPDDARASAPALPRLLPVFLIAIALFSGNIFPDDRVESDETHTTSTDETGEISVGERLVILVNDNVKEGVEVGEYYAKRRGIPVRNICHISTKAEEVIAWEEFRKEILEPLREFLKDRRDVLYIVPVFGVPVKLAESDPSNDGSKEGDIIQQFVEMRDHCSIDTELAAMRIEHEIEGWTKNPYFGLDHQIETGDEIYIVCRLDGLTADIARSLVDKALAAEALGWEGNCYVDARGIKDGDYMGADRDILAGYDLIKARGLPCFLDTDEKVQDLSGYEKPVFYWGWYTEHLRPSKEFQFATGAVAAHLHSASAVKLRTKDQFWAGPLLYYGATCTMGTVYEPLTAGFPFCSLFVERFLDGYNFGETGYMALMYISWQAVFVGDPLYAPFREGYEERWAANRELLKTGPGKAQELITGEKYPEALELIGKLLSLGVEREEVVRTRSILKSLEEKAAGELEGILKRLATRQTQNDIQALEKVIERYEGLGAAKKGADTLAIIRERHETEAKKLWERFEKALSKKQYTESLAILRAIVRDCPASDSSRDAGTRLAELEQDPEVQSSLAREMADRDTASWWNMAESALKNNMPDLAREYLQKIIETYPDHPYAERAREKLKEM